MQTRIAIGVAMRIQLHAWVQQELRTPFVRCSPEFSEAVSCIHVSAWRRA